MPKVSILVPLYNTEPEHLRAMIDSVLTQTWTDFELLLLNDSPQNRALQAIVSTYQDERIHYEDNPHNMGISASRNRLIEMAQGEYLAVLDHDDQCFPDRLAKQVAYLDEHPEVGVVSGAIHTIPKNQIMTMPENNLAIKRLMLTSCPLVHPAAMIRKSVLIKNNIRYEENYSPAEDYMLWVRLMGVTMFHNLPDPLIYYRDHEDNTTHRRAELMADAGLRARCIALNAYPLYAPEHALRYWIYLFGVIPFIKVKHRANIKEYSLFGTIPLWTVKA